MRTTISTVLALALGITGFLSEKSLSQARFTVTSTEPLIERLMADAEDTRWRWGTFRVQPTMGIGNLGFVDNVFVDSDSPQPEAINDFNLSAFAGLNIYQVLSDRAALAFILRPQYVWWQDLEDRRRLNLHAGAAAAVELNRVFFDGELQRTENQNIVTEEAEQLINSRRDILDATFGVSIYRSLAITVAYLRDESENLLDEQSSALVPDFTRLDDTTETRTVGLRGEPWRNTTIQLGYGERESEAVNTLRKFKGDGPTLDVVVNQNALSIIASIQDFDLGPVGTSNFEPYQDFTGQVAVILGTAEGRSLFLQADKSLTASVRGALSDFESTRYTIASNSPLGERLGLQIAYTVGERAFRGSDRTDDTQKISATLQIDLARQTSLTARYEQSEIDSTNVDFDRNINRFTVGLSVGLPGLSWP